MDGGFHGFQASQMYQRAARAFFRSEQHASHCRIKSTSNEFLQECWSATRSLLEAARQAVLRMSKMGNIFLFTVRPKHARIVQHVLDHTCVPAPNTQRSCRQHSSDCSHTLHLGL